MSVILDNKSLGTVISKLKESISSGTNISVISALFSIYAFDDLKKEFSKIKNFRFLVPPSIE